jgi:hypothetical protein
MEERPFLAKHYKTNVVSNNEQTVTDKLGIPFIAFQQAYRTTFFDKTTKTVKKTEQLVISTIKRLDFVPEDIIEINNVRWVIESVNDPDVVFKRPNTRLELTLKRS